jgi:hypothetical protein
VIGALEKAHTSPEGCSKKEKICCISHALKIRQKKITIVQQPQKIQARHYFYENMCWASEPKLAAKMT